MIPEKSPEGDVVTKIDEYAFYDAEDIASIIFAGRNMEIADNAFQSCEVEKLVISGCELNIGESAFSYCDDLSSIYISNSRETVLLCMSRFKSACSVSAGRCPVYRLQTICTRCFLLSA